MKLLEQNGKTVFPCTTARRGNAGIPWMTSYGPDAIKSTDISILVDTFDGKEYKHWFDVAETTEATARAEFSNFLRGIN